ncbi:MAG TPA: hypothetical protein VGM88_01245 [Kofleriaceae bacterium]
MKKCASCSKDLPDAALHCVFCGAKQATAAPAAAQAKTVMGYQAADVVAQLKAQGISVPGPAGQPPVSGHDKTLAAGPPGSGMSPLGPGSSPIASTYNPPAPQPMAPAPYAPPQAAEMKTQYAAPAPVIPQMPPQQPPPPQQQGFAPASHAQAKTMFVDGGPPALSPAQQQTLAAPPPAQPGGFGGGMGPSYPAPPAPVGPSPYQQPQQYNPIPVDQGQPIQQYQQPYQGHAPMPGRPVEPWQDSLKVQMFVWGALLLVSFATPIVTEPGLIFQWDAILHGAGAARITPLVIGAVGLLSIILAATPLVPAGRGLFAGLLGLAGVIVPIALVGLPEWPALLSLVGTIILLPALFTRNEYTNEPMPRVLVTVGGLMALVPYLVPIHDHVVIVELFKGLGADLPWQAKAGIAVMLVHVGIIVAAIALAWLPGPSTGGAKIWAWLLILFGLIVTVLDLVLGGHIGDVVKQAPSALTGWISGSGAALGGKDGAAELIGILPAAFGVLIGYGFASVFGKQLE